MVRASATSLLAALLLLGCSSGASLEPAGAVLEPIAGGAPDHDHAEVLELIVEFGGGAVALCTGTLIAPNLVLSARHCVSRGGGENVTCGSQPFSTPVAGSGVHATAAFAPTQSSVFYDGRSVSVPPEGNDTCGFDLSLVTLAENVPPDVARPAIPRIDLRGVSGESYSAFGYGVDDFGNQTAGRMRLDGLVVQCAADRCSGFDVAPSEFMGEAGVCSGDSGGPALDPEGRVIGVLSRGSDPCGTPVYGAVASFRDWIMSTALAAADAGGYAPPFWALSGSSDRPPGAVGDPCVSSDDCTGGSVCYFESDPALAACTATCTGPADCPAATTCVTGFDVPGGALCLTPRRPLPDPDPDSSKKNPPDDSCSIRTPHAAPPSSAFALSLALFALSLITRRRRP